MLKHEIERLNDLGLAAWNQHDPDAFVELLSDDFVIYDWTLPGPIRSKDEARKYMQDTLTAFPDMSMEAVVTLLGDDHVVCEVEWTGTNSGPLEVVPGSVLPATGRSVNGHGSYIARVRGGKIYEFRAYLDAAGMMMQLGLIPLPGTSEAQAA
jgi:steroid delta-isomerase-like uncharacterized protein